MNVNLSADKSNKSLDLVYVPEGSDEFRSVHIEIRAKGDKLQIYINSPTDIENTDLEVLINKIQRDTLAKMKIRVVEDCNIFLNVNDKVYEIEFAPSIIKVGGLRLLDH